MPFLLIPIFLIIIGVVMLGVIGLAFSIIHVLFWPVVIGLFIWWLVGRANGTRHRYYRQRPTHHHTDWQEGLHERKAAKNVHEEKQTTHHDDDWSDF